MAWSASAIFQQSMLNPIALGVGATTGFPTTYGSTGLLGDTVNVALYGTATPDKTAAYANIGYGTGIWSGTEITSSTQWPAGGVALSSKAWSLDSGSSSIVFHAANASGSGTVTLTAFFGCMVYDNTIAAGTTVAKQGMCFNYFGGSQTVTSGTFTLIWATVGATTGVFNITV